MSSLVCLCLTFQLTFYTSELSRQVPFSFTRVEMDATLEARWPQELTDAIIDHLADDHTTLKACSLVCKAWVSRSQQLIHARPIVDFERLMAAVETALPLSSVAGYVKEISLHGAVGDIEIGRAHV